MNRIQRLLTLLLLVCGMITGLWASSTSGALTGRFTINASGEKVVFSQGNLQYVGTWQFAENQWDCFSTSQYNDHRDLFGWGTGDAPNKVSNNNGDYGTFTDWGTNAITNGGNTKNSGWRTLTKDEWVYLFYSRENAATLFGFGNVNGMNGLIILPDNWTTPEGASFTASTTLGLTNLGSYYHNDKNDNYSHNTYTAEQWAVMESAGAVFLPAAAYRHGADSNIYYTDGGGFYWSSTPSSTDKAYYLNFYYNDLDPQFNEMRYGGRPVRLVRSSLDQDNEGYYLIGSVQDWKDFATLVETTPTANARMTADIDLGDDQTTIGNPGETTYNYFEGTFDGQGHTLTVHYVKQGDKDIRSPFPNISEATIKNIHITGTIESSTACQPAVIGCVRNGTSTIENVWSSVELTSTKSSWCEASGLVGCVDGYRNGHLVMTDCMISGNIISSGSYEGCFIGYINSGGSATVSNCMSVANFTYSGTSGFQGNYTNCYVKQFPSSIPAVMQVTDAQLADGTTATALQNNRAETVWVQDPLTNQPMLAVFAGKYTMPASGLGTFSAKANFTLPEGLEAYYCKDYDSTNGSISVVGIEGTVPAETGVLLRGTAGETYTLTISDDEAATVTDNALVAVTEQTTIQQTADINEVNYTNFGLSGGVFKKVNTNGGTVKANRAYLRIPTSALTPEASARGISLAWDGEPTGVESIHNSECIIHNPDGAYYTLDGRRLQAEPAKGLYIVNGKKVVIK